MNCGEYLLKPRKALSDIQNLATGISDKTPVKHEQVIESPVYFLTSPAPPKIPFASMSLLQKLILQSDLRKEPIFSAPELSPARKLSSHELVDDNQVTITEGRSLRFKSVAVTLCLGYDERHRFFL